jgi:DNA polymerase III epsilon subunit-like protein
MAEYFKLRSGLSRPACTWMEHYFYRDATGRLAEVIICEDGFSHRRAASFRCQRNEDWPGKPGQKPAPAKYVEIPGAELAVPAGALPCPAAEYEAARHRVLDNEKQQQQERSKEIAFLKSLRKGMSRQAHAAEEAGAAEAVVVPLPAAHFLSDFTILDFETAYDKPIELAAIRYQNWQPVGQLHTFVALPAGEFVPGRITNLTGITSRMLRGAPDVKQVLTQFKGLAGPSLLIAHNVVYDRRILENTRQALGARRPLANAWLCTLTAARTLYPEQASHKLPDLCEHFGLSSQGHHRALKDVQMTFSLLERMHQQRPLPATLIGCTSVAKAKKNAVQPSLFAA